MKRRTLKVVSIAPPLRLDPKRIVDVREYRDSIGLKEYADRRVSAHKVVATERMRRAVRRAAQVGAADTGVSDVFVPVSDLASSSLTRPIVNTYPDTMLLFSEFAVNAEGEGSGANCGIGPGGFQPGNTCGKGGSGPPDPIHARVLDAVSRYSGGAHAVKLASDLKMTQKAVKGALAALHGAGHIEDLGGGIYGAKRAAAPATSAPIPPAVRASSGPVAVTKAAASAAPMPTARPAIAPLASPSAHAPAIARAILGDSKGLKHNLIDVADLSARSGKSPADTLSIIHHLRKEGILSASYYEGRGTLSPAQLAVKEVQAGTKDVVGLVSVKDMDALHRLAHS